MTRRIIRVAIILLTLVGLPLAGWRLYLARTINKELALIRTAGLPANGEELNRWYAAVPDSQNAALVLTQAFALRRNYSDSRSNLINNFKAPKRALSLEQAELLRGYLEMNAPRRKKADEALQLPACRYPVDCTMLMSTPLPHLAWLDDIAELYEFEALIAMESGDTVTVTTDIVTILALARTLNDEPCLISQFVRLKLMGRAFTTLERRVSAGSVSGSEIAGLADAFRRTGLTNLGARALIGDRALCIPYFRMTRAEAERINPPKPGDDSQKDSPAPCNGPAILRLIGYYELDYGTYLLGMKKAIALLSNAPPDNLRASAHFSRVGEESSKRRRTLSGMALSSYAGVPWRENTGFAHQRLALTALAVEQFRNETGRLPGSLDDLAPKYVEEVPEDPFTGLLLEYRRTEMGYLIYSAGPDREDNGGLEKADKKQSEDGKSYDITFTVER
jgi:hypothetical protein